MFRRILANSLKQIKRSGWVGWASVSVMTLAFLVAIIFGGLAYISNLYIQFIETKSNLLVFFEEGMDREVVDRLRDTWKSNPKIKDIEYTTEAQAYEQYADYTAKVLPETYEILKTKEEKILPSSLDIQIWSLSDLESVKNSIQSSIDEELGLLKIIKTEESDTEVVEETPTEEGDNATEVTTEDVTLEDDLSLEEFTYKYQTDPNRPPIELRVDDKNLDQLREVLTSVRIAGIFIITLLFIVIFFFTFMTVEFRLYNQMEEIGVMQLVGGSLTFIRAPYILEGGFYGLIGSFISSIFIASVIFVVFVADSNSVLSTFIYENFSNLPWPYVSTLGWVGLILLSTVTGFLIGSISSFLSIKRYIR